MALPIAAMVLDQSPKTENWIFPAQVGGTALVGAGIGSALPQIAGHAATRGRGAAVGAGMGVGAAAIGAAALFAMINGFGG
jgi:hypothetical protein